MSSCCNSGSAPLHKFQCLCLCMSPFVRYPLTKVLGHFFFGICHSFGKSYKKIRVSDFVSFHCKCLKLQQKKKVNLGDLSGWIWPYQSSACSLTKPLVLCRVWVRKGGSVALALGWWQVTGDRWLWFQERDSWSKESVIWWRHVCSVSLSLTVLKSGHMTMACLTGQAIA